MDNRIEFIDLAKGICIISVYLLHAECYSGLIWTKSYGFLLQPFYVNAFFFISGFLLFEKCINTDNQYIINRGGVFEKCEKFVFSNCCAINYFCINYIFAKNAFS